MPLSLRVDLHARVDGQFVRVASARVPLSELFGGVMGDGIMRSVELHRFAPDQVALEQAHLLGIQAGEQPFEGAVLQKSSIGRCDDPRPVDGGGGATSSKAKVRRLSSFGSGSPTTGPAPQFGACAALPSVIEVGVTAAMDPKRILPVEVSWLLLIMVTCDVRKQSASLHNEVLHLCDGT